MHPQGQEGAKESRTTPQSDDAPNSVRRGARGYARDQEDHETKTSQTSRTLEEELCAAPELQPNEGSVVWTVKRDDVGGMYERSSNNHDTGRTNARSEEAAAGITGGGDPQKRIQSATGLETAAANDSRRH